MLLAVTKYEVRMNIKNFLVTLLVVNIIGISSALAENFPLNATTLSQIHWRDTTLPQSLNIELNEKQAQAFTLPFAGVESSIAAYRIPANQGSIELKIESAVENQQLFVPNIAIFDSHFNLAARYDSSFFKLEEEHGLKPNRLSATLNLTPIDHQDAFYLLIYTTKADLSGHSIVPHPSKLFAKATGKQPPAIADIEVAHSLNGKISLNIQSVKTTSFIGLGHLFGEEKKGIVTTNQDNHTTQTHHNALSISVDKETEAYFNQAVKNALKQKDINRALNLVNEAEKLGLTTPRKLFLQSVSLNK